MSHSGDRSHGKEVFNFICKSFVLRKASEANQSSLGVPCVVDLVNSSVKNDVIHKTGKINFSHFVPTELPEFPTIALVVNVGMAVPEKMSVCSLETMKRSCFLTGSAVV